jgi:hypothetical protein
MGASILGSVLLLLVVAGASVAAAAVTTGGKCDVPPWWHACAPRSRPPHPYAPCTPCPLHLQPAMARWATS